MTQRYFDDWDSVENLHYDFGITEADIRDEEILFASYTYKNYSGSAIVIFERGGRLYEVNGSHCSCHGLAEQNYSGDGPSQWQPEETSWEALKMRTDQYRKDGHSYALGVSSDAKPESVDALVALVESQVGR